MNPVLQAIVRAATGATGASKGWVLAVDGDELRAVAAAGDGAGELIGARSPLGTGTAGFVASSGQPMALAPRGDDPRLAEGMTALAGTRPRAIVSVPCGTEDAVLGVLELVDKTRGGSFSFDDVELATLLASIAGSALEDLGDVPEARSPGEIGAELGRLASADPEAYARVARVVEALLANG